ncbi:MAG: response regulator transcription factor [Alphaproteobacteria bacterium]|nr:response regulator transcription factor [Alphaproteobacteria bacterium]
MPQPQSPVLKPHILVVDDDDRLRELLRRYLAEQGLIVSTARSAEEARAVLKSFSYDLMVLDIMMPGETGLEMTRSMRQMNRAPGRQMPVLLLTARGEPSDRIEGFESGADDYLAKPFEPRELLLRIGAILRRAPKPPAVMPALKLGRWVYDQQRDELRSGSEIVTLTNMEAGLMRVLSAEPGVAVSREMLAEQARKGKEAVNDRTIDVQVTRLRRKIEEDAKNPRYLVTVRGEGYMLMPDMES